MCSVIGCLHRREPEMHMLVVDEPLDGYESVGASAAGPPRALLGIGAVSKGLQSCPGGHNERS